MKALILILAAGILSVTVIACSEDDDNGSLGGLNVTPEIEDAETEDTPGEVIAVTLSEYETKTSMNIVPAGEMTFAVSNSGEQAHQFVVIRTERPAEDLPLNETTGQVDLEAEELDVVIAQEAFPPGQGPNLVADLEPGNYVLICNLTGHYEQGMRAALGVTEESARAGAPDGGTANQ